MLDMLKQTQMGNGETGGHCKLDGLRDIIYLFCSSAQKLRLAIYLSRCFIFIFIVLRMVAVNPPTELENPFKTGK